MAARKSGARTWGRGWRGRRRHGARGRGGPGGGRRRCRRCSGRCRRVSGRRNNDARRERYLVDRGDSSHVVARLAEAGGWQSDLLLVVQRHALAHDAVDLLGNAVLPHGEQELLRRGPGHRHHRHLAFPGLAEPALAAELLHPAGTFAVRIVPLEHKKEITGGERERHDQQPEHELESGRSATDRRLRGRRGNWSVHRRLR